MRKILLLVVAFFIQSLAFADVSGEGSKVHPNMIGLLRAANLTPKEIFLDASEVSVAAAQAKGFKVISCENADPIVLENGPLRGQRGNGQRVAIYTTGRKDLGTFAVNRTLHAQFVQIIRILEDGTIQNGVQRLP